MLKLSAIVSCTQNYNNYIKGVFLKRLLWLILFSSNLLGAELMVLKSEFNNQNWFPLPKQDMRSAVVDSLISQIAQSYSFELVAADDSRRSSAGDIQISIDLVEKAQIIKVSAQWNSSNGASHISNHSLSLHGKLYDEIYNTMELLGRNAGRDILQQINNKKIVRTTDEDDKLNKILENQGDISSALMALEENDDAYIKLLKLKLSDVSSERQQEEITKEFDLASKQQLDLAARLKREGKFEQAYATLRSLWSRPALDEELKSAVFDELYFTLPIYQSDMVLSKIGENSQTYKQDNTLSSRIAKVQTRLEETLKHNEQDINKSTQINQRLDQIMMMSRYMSQAFKAQTISKLSPLRLYISMTYMERDSYPTSAELKEQMEYYDIYFDVEEKSSANNEVTYILKEAGRVKATINADRGQVKIEVE
ncbi:MAG: hypothetical protein ACJAQS_000822 [Porticoccus sp.]|jgi:hypothetical protein